MSTEMIKITGLKKSYGSLEVLKGIDLTIAEKEVVVIIGPSGSGKSTLLRCMNYLEEPTALNWTAKPTLTKCARK